MSDQRRAWDREYSKPHPLWKGPTRDEMPLSRGERVLELGCGNGKTAVALAKGGSEVIGLDFSRKGLEACRRTVGGDISLIEGDVARLPFASGSMDRIVAFHVLGHLTADERARAVTEMARVLRSRGMVSVRVFSRNDMRCGAGKEIEEGTFLRGNGIPCHFFTSSELRDMFSSFTVLSLDEERAPKRYDGKDLVRAELVGSFQKSEALPIS